MNESSFLRARSYGVRSAIPEGSRVTVLAGRQVVTHDVIVLSPGETAVVRSYAPDGEQGVTCTLDLDGWPPGLNTVTGVSAGLLDRVIIKEEHAYVPKPR